MDLMDYCREKTAISSAIVQKVGRLTETPADLYCSNTARFDLAEQVVHHFL